MSKPLSSCAPLNPYADVVAWDSDRGIQLYPVGERYFLYVDVKLVAICHSHVELQNWLKTLTVEQHVKPEQITMVPQSCYVPQPKLCQRSSPVNSPSLFGDCQMGEAVPCRNCGSQRLMFKGNSETGEYWVHCDGCGQIGPVKASVPAAGEAWNEANKPT